MKNTMGNRENKICRNSKGFTLLETLLVIAIIVVLLGLSIIGVIAIQKELRQRELDSKAEMIYMAAQNRLTELTASGRAELYEYPSKLNDIQPMGLVPLDSEDRTRTDKSLYYVTSAPVGSEVISTAAVLLPESRVEKEIRDNNWVIEYDPASGSVYAVFYSEKEMGYDAASFDELRIKQNRKKAGAWVGYYGGDAVISIDTNVLNPTIDIRNEEMLHAVLSCNRVKDGDVSFKVNIEDKFRNKVDELEIDSNTEGFVRRGNMVSYDLVLDKLDVHNADGTIKEDGNRFCEKYPELVAGSDITITLTAVSSSDLVDSASVSGKTNSLFAEVNPHEETGEEAVISYCRHLQNLDVASGVNSKNKNGSNKMYIKYAVQKNNLHFENDEENMEDWYSLYGERAYKAVDANYGFSLLSYCGSYTDDSKTLKSIIFGLDTKIGMFDDFKGTELKDITLSGAKISGDERAGAIAGTLSSGSAVTVSGCQVYLSRAEGDLTDKTEQDKWITGSVYTGGLIARTSGTVTIKDSFAATVAGNLSTTNTGGLVGYVTGTLTLDNSYADCYLYGQNTGGLVGAAADDNSNITISNCYSAGYITATKKAAGFVPEAVSKIEKSYSAVAYMQHNDKYADHVYATVSSYADTPSKVYYLNPGGIDSSASQVGTLLRYKELNGDKAKYAGELGDKFSAATGGDNTNAYNLMKQGLTDYSFPKLANLPHYGDWKADFEENRPVYYEVYQGSGTTGVNYGIYGANLDTLAGSGSAIGDGYGVIYKNKPTNNVTVKYGGDTYNLAANTAVMITTGTDEYWLLKFPTEVVNAANAPEDFYHEISIDDITYYYNPHFAKNITTEKPSKVSNVYVRTARQLHNMSMYYSSYAAKTKASVYTQELDIKYDTYEWTDYANRADVTVQNPIGTGNKPVAGEQDVFNSTYNGGSHVIEGVSFVSDTYYTGLFGYNKGKLRNIAVVSDYGKGTDRYIAINNKIEGSKAKAYAGVLAGRNSGTITNCAAAGYTSKIYTYRSSSSYIGGLVGYNSKSIRNSSAECPDFKISETYAAVKAGGFIGTNTGNISGCYSIGRLNIIDARQGNAAAAGFAGSNSGVINKAYCAVSITISGSAKGYGFAPTGGNLSDCKYLNNGTYYYTEVLNAYDIDVGDPRAVPVKADKLIGSTDLGKEANNAYYHSKTGDIGYPYPAVVKKGTEYVHYGNWPVETELGNVGVFYWEHEDGGPNSGYHFRYLGVTDDRGIDGSSLCTAHNDGGIVKDFGYGYYYKSEAKDKVNLQMTDFADKPVVNDKVSAKIKEQISGYEVVAYTTGNTADYSDADGRKGKLYLDKKDNRNNSVKVDNGTWKLSYTETKGTTDTTTTYQYSVCPFFANSFSLDGTVNGSSVTEITDVTNFDNQTETPGTEANKYQIRSVDQLQFINWNYRYLNATSYVNSTSANWDSFTYLKYASGNTADYEWNFYWDQTHDIESQQQPATEGETKAEQDEQKEYFTPIGSLYYPDDTNTANAYIAYFGGVYNGDSYAIKNINIASDAQMVGLFGITIAAKLENIVMYSENVNDTIEITENSKRWYCVGGLVGFAAEGDVSEGETSKAVFQNCTVSGYKIVDNRTEYGGWGGGSIGGLAGATNMDISKCTAVNDITTNAGFNDKDWQNIRVGGLVGNCRSTIDGCYAGGSITSNVKTIKDSGIGNSASVWVGGINGGIVMIDVGSNLKDIIGTTSEAVKVKNSYSYVNLPATGANQIRGSQSIASIGEMQEGFKAITNPYLEITNCYAYADSVKNAQDYKDTSKHSSQYWSGVNNGDKENSCIFYLDSNGGERYISLDNGGKSPYVTYEQLSAASGQPNVIDLLNQNGVKFGFVTTEENGARIDGKYSYPGNDSSLEGVNYPFPTVLTQEDTDGRTVNVHYGTWPKGDLYWQNSMNSFDMIENDELQMNLIFKGTYDSSATPKFEFLDEDRNELTDPLLEFKLCTFVTDETDGNRYQVIFKALKEGTVTVKATLGNDTAEALVSITADLLITAEPAELNIDIPTKDTAALGLTVKSVNGTIDFANNVKWSINIDDPNVALVDDPTYDAEQKKWIMNVTGLKSGETSITAVAEVTKDSKTFTKEINIVVNVTDGNDTIDPSEFGE